MVQVRLYRVSMQSDGKAVRVLRDLETAVNDSLLEWQVENPEAEVVGVSVEPDNVGFSAFVTVAWRRREGDL